MMAGDFIECPFDRLVMDDLNKRDPRVEEESEYTYVFSINIRIEKISFKTCV